MAGELSHATTLHFLAAGPRFLFDEQRAIERVFARRGTLYSAQVPGFGRVVIVARPDLVRAVMTADAEVVDATEGQRGFEPIYGPRSVFLRDGEPHRRLRKLLVPPLRGDALARHRETIATVTARAVDGWRDGQTVKLLPELHHVGLEIILRVVVGVTDVSRWEGPFARLMRLGLSDEMAARYLLRRAGAVRRWGRLNRTLAACDALLYGEIARRRSAEEGDDVLGLMLEAGLTDDEARDQLMTLLVAGHETTATTCAWAFERLVRHPAALEQLAAEARAGDGDAYAQAVVTETLRLRPPIWAVARVVRAPFDLDGHRLAPGTILAPYLPKLHRDPATYPEPLAFRPERWLDDKPPMFAWAPFGGGVHRCLGDHFARFELATMLHTIAGRVSLAPAGSRDDEPVKRRGIAHFPGRGCAVVVRR